MLVTGDFKSADDEKKEEIVNTLELMGWSKGKIEECIKQAPREKLSNADDAVSQIIQTHNLILIFKDILLCKYSTTTVTTSSCIICNYKC